MRAKPEFVDVVIMGSYILLAVLAGLLLLAVVLEGRYGY